MQGIYTLKDLNKRSKSFFKPKYLKIDEYINFNEEEYKSNKNDIILKKV